MPARLMSITPTALLAEIGPEPRIIAHAAYIRIDQERAEVAFR